VNRSLSAASPVAKAESPPAFHKPSARQQIAAFLAQNVADLDPRHMIWLATLLMVGLVVAAALLAVFVVTH
jgi:hypothetical protein